MRNYGLKPEPGGVRDYDFFACCGAGEQALPSRFLLPIDEWAEVLDQGAINACVGYALATAQQCHYYKVQRIEKRWSPGYIYGHPECRLDYNGEGMYLSQAMKGVSKIGFVPCTLFDIIEEMPQMRSYVESRPDLTEHGARRKLKGFVSLNYALKSRMVEAMKRAIYDYRIPLVVSSYDYFGGAHCFLLYGWDDSWTHKKATKGTQIFALRNSWGKEYEDGGNSTIPVTYIDQVYLPLFEDMPMPFSDVSSSEWFYNDVRAAAFSGLVEGVTRTTFQPYSDMKRGDMAVVISRTLTKMADSVNMFIKTLHQKGMLAYEVSLAGAKDCKQTFEDIQSADYYYDAIRMVCANGLMNGTGADRFEPERAITRAEVAAILSRGYEYALELLKKAVPSATLTRPRNEVPAYTDVTDGEWFADHVAAASRLGLMQGDGDGGFRPNANINRAECTAVLNRFFKLVDKALEEIR